MTLQEDTADESFRGLMKSLNLDEAQFKTYTTGFHQLNFQQLAATKVEIENQLSTLFRILQGEYNANMETELVSRDGFPRADIDIVSIRLIRVKVIRLKNDYKEVLIELESKMEEEFTRRKAEGGEKGEEGEPAIDTLPSTIPQSRPPFAIVRDVATTGPAFKSGLRDGDHVVLFDNVIHAANHEKLSGIVTRVRGGIDKKLPVQVLRNGVSMELELIPSKWEGQGLLGCRLMPL